MRLLDDLKSAAVTSAQDARALPFAAYTDPAVFDLEMERCFSRDWVAVCPSAELAKPGQCLATTIGREPVVIVRNDNGELRALSNVCRHRGTILQDEGIGEIKKFVCPYHAWTYDFEGKLRGVPMPGSVKIDKAAHCLPRFGVGEWAGVVFVNLDVNAEPLRDVLSGIAPYVGAFGINHFDTLATPTELEDWNANWKLIVENAMESYHLFRVHEKTLETVTPTKSAFLIEGSARWTVTGGYYTDIKGPLNAGALPELAAGKGYLLVSIPPSFVGILTSDSWGWLSVRPQSADRSIVAAAALRMGKPGMMERLAGNDAAAEFTKAFFAEDKHICERGQRGMASRHSSGGQLVELERVVVDFHHYLAWRLFDLEGARDSWRTEAAIR